MTTIAVEPFGRKGNKKAAATDALPRKTILIFRKTAGNAAESRKKREALSLSDVRLENSALWNTEDD